MRPSRSVTSRPSREVRAMERIVSSRRATLPSAVRPVSSSVPSASSRSQATKPPSFPLSRVHRAAEPRRSLGERWGGKKLDGADRERLEIHDAASTVPYADAVVEVASLEPIEGDDGAALERRADLSSFRLEPGEVAEAHLERARDCQRMTAFADLDPEHRDRLALTLQPFGRDVHGPWVVELDPVEQVVPRTPPAIREAQPALVDRAVFRGDPTIEATWSGALRRRARRSSRSEHWRAPWRRGVEVRFAVFERAVAGDEGEEDHHGHSRRRSDRGFRQCDSLS